MTTAIQFGKGWNCCRENPSKVVVFDSGARWAVCGHCASMYRGEVQELPEDVKESNGMTDNGVFRYTSTGSTKENRDMYAVGDPNRVPDNGAKLVTVSFESAEAYRLIDNLLNSWIDQETGVLERDPNFDTLQFEIKALASAYPESFSWCMTARKWSDAVLSTEAGVGERIGSTLVPQYDDLPYGGRRDIYARMFMNVVYRGAVSMSRAVRRMGGDS